MCVQSACAANHSSPLSFYFCTLKDLTDTICKLTSAGLFMKGREALFSALRLTTDDDLAAGVAGAKAEADPARMARMVAFIMVELS